MNDYHAATAKFGIGMLGIATIVILILTGIVFYFLSVGDAIVFLASAFTAIYISFGEEATRIREEIEDTSWNGKQDSVPHLRGLIIIRLVISAVIAIAGLIAIFGF